MPTNSLFCLSVIVITLRNCPRGESSRDVMLINLMRLILQTEFADERLESPLVYNNLISPDLSIELRGTNGPQVPVQPGAGRGNAAETGTEAATKPSDNEEEECPPGHVSATDEDSDEDLPRQGGRRRRRRRGRKRMYDEAATQPLDSSSGNDHHHLLKTRKQRRSVQGRANGSPGRSRARGTLAGRKRTKCWPRREEYATKDEEDETLTSLLETRRKSHKRPAQPGSSRSKEPVLGPSGKTTRWPKGKGQHFQFGAKATRQESQEASSKEPLTGRRKRKRPRKDDEDPTKSPSTTDSEEAQPKPLRKRKKKKR